MYNPDQQYEAHSFHLKELSAQAEQHLMIAALAQNRPARIRAAGRRLGVVLVRLGTWLSRSATSSQPCASEDSPSSERSQECSNWCGHVPRG